MQVQQMSNNEITITPEVIIADQKKCLQNIISKYREELFNENIIDLEFNLTDEFSEVFKFFEKKYDKESSDIIVLTFIYHYMLDQEILEKELEKSISDIHH